MAFESGNLRPGSVQWLLDESGAPTGFVDAQGDNRSLFASLGDVGEESLFSIFGEDIVLVTTYANLPSPASVPVGKGAICTDYNNLMLVSTGTAWVAPARTPIARGGTPASKSDLDTGEFTAATVAIPAGLMKPGSQLECTLLWNVPTGAAAKRLRGRFGGTVLFNIDLTTHESFLQRFVLVGRDSLSAQVASPNNASQDGTYASNELQTFTVDFTAAQSLTFTAQWPVAGAGSNAIVLEGYRVEYIP